MWHAMFFPFEARICYLQKKNTVFVLRPKYKKLRFGSVLGHIVYKVLCWSEGRNFLDSPKPFSLYPSTGTWRSVSGRDTYCAVENVTLTPMAKDQNTSLVATFARTFPSEFISMGGHWHLHDTMTRTAHLDSEANTNTSHPKQNEWAPPWPHCIFKGVLDPLREYGWHTEDTARVYWPFLPSLISSVVLLTRM